MRSYSVFRLFLTASLWIGIQCFCRITQHKLLSQNNFINRSNRSDGLIRVHHNIVLKMSLTDEQQQKMRLREEVENPFRKVRFFFFYAFIGSASVGLLIALLRTAALTQGIYQGQTMNELFQNIGIDVLTIVVCYVLLQRDTLAQSSRLKRMEIGAKLASLKVRLQDEADESTVTLSAFRRQRGRDKRVAVVVGGSSPVSDSLQSAVPYSEELFKSDIVIVPLVLELRNDQLICGGGESLLESAVGMKHVALPVMLNGWQEWVDNEIETAQKQGFDVLKEGFAVILKKNGRVGTRSKGCPPWNVLVGNVQARTAANMDVTNI